jgi:hypothetical protein
MATNESFPRGLPPLQHQTVEVRDVHYLGEDGLPEVHDTRQRIRALDTLETPMTHMPYRFDANTAQVVVTRGGIAGQLYQAAEGIYAVDIALAEPLEPGEETELEYATFFNYHEAPPPEFRRRIGAKAMEHLDISVVFNELWAPAHVWQSEWQDHTPDSPITLEEPASPTPLTGELEAGTGVHVRYDNVADRTVGFRWEWPPKPTEGIQTTYQF